MVQNMNVKNVFFFYSILLVTFIILFFGVSGPLILDDFHNLEPLGYFGGVVNWESAQRFIFGNASGPLGRPVAIATFLLNDFTWPPSDLASFKITNVAFHLCTGSLIFVLVNRLLQQEFNVSRIKSEKFALVIMAFWLLHPIHASTVFYVIQRMAILSALFTAATFIFYIQFRLYFKKQQRLYSYISLACGVLFFLVGIFSKENALLVLPFIIICELFLFDSLLSAKHKLFGRRLIYTLTFVAPILLVLTFDVWGWAYAFRDFSVTERLILQIAVLGDYVGKLVFPTVSGLNLFNERFTPDAISTDNADFIKGCIFSFILLCVLLFSIAKNNRLIVFGILWFLCFHLMESSFLPLEIYYEHRNYLPSVGILIVVVNILSQLGKLLSSQKTFTMIIFGSYISYICFCSIILSKTWGDTSSLFIKFEGDEPTSVRAKINYAAYLEDQGLPELAMPVVEEAIKLRPDMLSLGLAKLRISCDRNLPIDNDELAKHIREASYFEIGALNQLKRIVEISEEDCPILQRYPKLIQSLFTSMLLMKGSSHKPTVMANLYYLKTNYYVNKKMFQSAMEALDKAIEYTPTVDLFLRKSDLLGSAGLYKEAVEASFLALIADEKRGSFTPSRYLEIKMVQNKFQKEL